MLTTELISDFSAIKRLLGQVAAPTPFGHSGWLTAWYATLGTEPGTEPAVVAVRNVRGELVLVVPLCRYREGRLRIIGFADRGVSDYNSSLIGPAWRTQDVSPRKLWRAIRRALPAADVLLLNRMHPGTDDRPEPLLGLSGVRPSPLHGNVVEIGPVFEEYHRDLEKRVRKELERSWRVFSRTPEAEFRIITDPDEAMRVLKILERNQSDRIQEIGKTYLLDNAHYCDLYRRVLADHVLDGFATLSALMVGNEVVAALLGLRTETSYAMVRIVTGDKRWNNCSPGRLLIDRTMAALHAQGLRHFDFTLGNYAYKRRLGTRPVPLHDLMWPLSPIGWPTVLMASARFRLRALPLARWLINRWRRSQSEPRFSVPNRDG